MSVESRAAAARAQKAADALFQARRQAQNSQQKSAQQQAAENATHQRAIAAVRAQIQNLRQELANAQERISQLQRSNQQER
jgi:hypothetical protein